MTSLRFMYIFSAAKTHKDKKSEILHLPGERQYAHIRNQALPKPLTSKHIDFKFRSAKGFGQRSKW